MGALYLAVHGERGMEKLCVVKTALHHLAGRGYVQRFRDEAKVVVRLSHGNLVAVFDAGQVEGEIFLAMDFVEGKDLRAVWNRCAQKGIAFPIDVAVHLTKELVRGLGYAHSFEGLSLVHRDISPPNVLLSYTGEVKLTDFGLASSTLKLEKTAPGIIYGKVSYMAPEQARGEQLDGRADLYAAGIILWELLTGRQLFPASRGPMAPTSGADDELLDKVRHPVVMAPSQRARRVPPELDRIVLRALASDQAARYQTGEEMRTELAAFQAKTAPATDNEQVARFLRDLFGEVIDRERADRAELVASVSEMLAQMTPRPQLTDDSDRTTQKDGRPLGGSSTSPSLSGVSPGESRDKTQALAPPQENSQIVGSVLQGRYSIKRLIGEGGMGRVYEAEHVEIGKRVAVKVLHPAYSRTPEVVERFRREARAASKIGHPNIVNVTDSGTTEDGSFFFVMEHIEGFELGYVIHKEGPLPVDRALRITEQMCQALQAAHDAGIIHRDLKPENVLLVSKEGPDFVKVLDFGIAKSADMEDNIKSGPGRKLTRPGVAMGTPEYMAPEQAAGKPADPRSDIYAVASILYEMLSATAPYDGDNVMEVLHKKANQAPKPLREIRPEIPPAVADLVNRGMARNPAARPQTMGDLAKEIQSLLLNLGSVEVPLVALGPVRSESPAVGAIESASVPLSTMSGLPFSRRNIALGAAALALVGLFVIVRAATSARARLAQAPATAATAPPPAPEPVVPVPAAAVTPAPEPPPAEELRPVEEPTPVRRAPTPPGKGKLSVVDSRKLLDDGLRLMQAQRFDDARANFTKLLDSKQKGAALVGLGKIAFQEKNFAEAIRRAQEGVKAHAGAEAHNLLGNAYFRLEKYPDAVKAYGEALKLDPYNANAKSSLETAKKRAN